MDLDRGVSRCNSASRAACCRIAAPIACISGDSPLRAGTACFGGRTSRFTWPADAAFGLQIVSVYHELMSEICLDICFSMHRSVKLGLFCTPRSARSCVYAPPFTWLTVRRRLQGRCKRSPAAVPARRLLCCNTCPAQRDRPTCRHSQPLGRYAVPHARHRNGSVQRHLRKLPPLGVHRRDPMRRLRSEAAGSDPSTSANALRVLPHISFVRQAARYAPHLAKCMGKGRTAARNASRRCCRNPHRSEAAAHGRFHRHAPS